MGKKPKLECAMALTPTMVNVINLKLKKFITERMDKINDILLLFYGDSFSISSIIVINVGLH